MRNRMMNLPHSTLFSLALLPTLLATGCGRPGGDMGAGSGGAEALIEAVRKNKPLNSGYHMTNSTMVGVLGQLACYGGKPVRWEDVWESDFSFGPPPEEASLDMKPPTQPNKTGSYPLPIPGVTKLQS